MLKPTVNLEPFEDVQDIGKQPVILQMLGDGERRARPGGTGGGRLRCWLWRHRRWEKGAVQAWDAQARREHMCMVHGVEGTVRSQRGLPAGPACQACAPGSVGALLWCSRPFPAGTVTRPEAGFRKVTGAVQVGWDRSDG